MALAFREPEPRNLRRGRGGTWIRVRCLAICRALAATIDIRCSLESDVLRRGEPDADSSQTEGETQAQTVEVQEGLRQEEGQMRKETQASQEVRPRQQEDRQMMMRIGRIAIAASLVVGVFASLGLGASPALAETHPYLRSFGSFSNPNGIAIDEASGDVNVPARFHPRRQRSTVPGTSW